MMRNVLILLITGYLFLACNGFHNEKKPDFPKVNWENRMIDLNTNEPFFNGSTYLSVYSEIYSYSEERTYDLTVTVSMKYIYRQDTVYITKAEYFNTEGKSIRTYVDKPVYIKPMETLEIVIDQKDLQGGSGGNFLFDWRVKNQNIEPHFEAVMISTYGQQGLSFTSQGIRIH